MPKLLVASVLALTVTIGVTVYVKTITQVAVTTEVTVTAPVPGLDTATREALDEAAGTIDTSTVPQGRILTLSH